MTIQINELEELSKSIKHELEENTVVVFKVPKDVVNRISKNVHLMPVWRRYNIVPIIIPDAWEVTVIPQGSGIKID